MSSKTEPAPYDGPRDCAIADTLDLVGDRWSLLVLRELGLGVHRFNEIHQNTGAPHETLAARLHKLEEAGIIDRRRYSRRPHATSTYSPMRATR